jgi:hypothetical protein
MFKLCGVGAAKMDMLDPCSYARLHSVCMKDEFTDLLS